MPHSENIKKYVRAANYLSAIQIYLKDNYLLERDLIPEDIKPRLLGHWGTCPGINFVYAHLNNLIKTHDQKMMFILGPGHGFPALQANLFLEGSLEKYVNVPKTFEGIAKIAHDFSWPYGFPSHSNPEAPGVILEGGELGYALSTAYGSVLDNPDLITVALIGDGEAETGPTAGAWHLNKLVHPKENGSVLPILHLNGYKISGPTIFGRMENSELRSLFYGYGYEPLVVQGDDDELYDKFQIALSQSYETIKDIQEKARNGKNVVSPRLPMIVLKTPKGWTGIKEIGSQKIEGNHLSHQVPAKNARTDPEELKLVQNWFKSYNFQELFSKETGFVEDIEKLVPVESLRLGEAKPDYKPLNLPDTSELEEKISGPGHVGSLSMRKAGEYLREVFRKNESEKNFRLMSPDETYSNKLDPVFEVTKRAFTWPIEPWDKDIGPHGRVMEMLSEHNLQGLMQGYVLTGRHAVFASYEAFIQIVASMADQYAKFMEVAREVDFRGEVPSLNYILTSSGWRQEHNGFSHQNPGFIDDMLQRQGCFVNVYFPPDANSLLAVLRYALSTTREINIIVAGKKTTVNWLTVDEAQKYLERGMAIWDFASDPDPDIVFCGIGDYVTSETLAALQLLKTEAPEIKSRFVNVMTLTAMGVGHENCRIDFYDFKDFFTADKPVILNFHGYPQTMKQTLFDYNLTTERFSVHGYIESGSTTTAFDMQARNQTSRYHLLIEAVNTLASRDVLPQDKAETITKKYTQKLIEHKEYIKKHGQDPDEIENWTWQK